MPLTTYRASFSFKIGTGLLVAGDALAQELSLVVDGTPVRVRIPEAAATPLDPDAPAIPVQLNMDGTVTGAQVKQIAVDIDMTADEVEHADMAANLFGEALSVAEHTVSSTKAIRGPAAPTPAQPAGPGRKQPRRSGCGAKPSRNRPVRC